MSDETVLIKAARQICANSLGGFCQNMGDSVGCKNGRGDSGAFFCKATYAQLVISGYVDTAQKVLAVGTTENPNPCVGALNALRELRRRVEQAGLSNTPKFKSAMEQATIALGKGY